MSSAIVLGAGMVGSVMAADLAADFDVTVADVSPQRLEAATARASHSAPRARPFLTRQADLSDPAQLRRLIEPFDIVVGALPSRLGFAALRTAVEAGKNCCDISFFVEDALELDKLAKRRGVTAVVDCGVAPGMSNMLGGAEVAAFEREGGHAVGLAIYVGGLPRERRWPFQYKAAFAPADVIEEYTRLVRLVEDGHVVFREALSDAEYLDFAGLGTLEAVNTDGLRTLATTLKVPNMREKTLRYPGHYELMRVFRETGLFGEDEVLLANGQRVRPRDVTAAVMFPVWTYQPGEEDLTVMRVIVDGETGRGDQQRVTWDLLDYFDGPSQATSMSRTTGLTYTTVARLIVSGRVGTPGVIPPETIGATPGMLEEVLGVLASKNIRYRRSVTSEMP